MLMQSMIAFIDPEQSRRISLDTLGIKFCKSLTCVHEQNLSETKEKMVCIVWTCCVI